MNKHDARDARDARKIAIIDQLLYGQLVNLQAHLRQAGCYSSRPQCQEQVHLKFHPLSSGL
ncbi:MAG: hypothetical protein Q8N36_02710 [bacterium]|nr:hypothetical protein [bacterium]